jgi:hypothetical protein
MLITGVVLSYSLYPLVTSGLLYTLQCVYIPGPFAAESATVEYSRRHYDWLLQRAAANVSSSGGGVGAVTVLTPAAADGSAAAAARDIQLCRPGQGALESGLCWVTGRFWAMDYDVQVGGRRCGAVQKLLLFCCQPRGFMSSCSCRPAAAVRVISRVLRPVRCVCA